MRPFTIFNIAIAVLSVIMILAGAVILSRTDTGYWILYSGLLLAAIFSFTSIIDVIKARSLNSGRRTLWLIMVICVPVFGGLLYYVIQYGKQGTNVISTPDYEDNV